MPRKLQLLPLARMAGSRYDAGVTSVIDSVLVEPCYARRAAARLVGLPTVTVGRWLDWCSPSSVTNQGDVSFLGLIELLYVKALNRDGGLSLQRIRRAQEAAREVTGVEHPFATRKCYASSREVFLATEDADLIALIDKRQHGIALVLTRILPAFEFTEQDIVKAWWPDGRDRDVVIDPYHAFGSPRVAGTNTRTDVLLDAWEAEGRNTERVAAWYQLTITQVEAALSFEQRLRFAA